jgi:hypothetical protein
MSDSTPGSPDEGDVVTSERSRSGSGPISPLCGDDGRLGALGVVGAASGVGADVAATGVDVGVL